MSNNSVAGKPGLDPTLPDVELVIGGVIYKLAYDFNAVCQAEKITGVNLLASVIGEVTATSLRGLLWAALLKGHPKITIEEVGEMIRPSDVAIIREAITTAWFGSVQEPEAGEAEARS